MMEKTVMTVRKRLTMFALGIVTLSGVGCGKQPSAFGTIRLRDPNGNLLQRTCEVFRTQFLDTTGHAIGPHYYMYVNNKSWSPYWYNLDLSKKSDLTFEIDQGAEQVGSVAGWCSDEPTAANGYKSGNVLYGSTAVHLAPGASNIINVVLRPATKETPPPPPDSDGDGVIDADDKCPNQKGDIGNNGCPPAPIPPSGACSNVPVGFSFMDFPTFVCAPKPLSEAMIADQMAPFDSYGTIVRAWIDLGKTPFPYAVRMKTMDALSTSALQFDKNGQPLSPRTMTPYSYYVLDPAVKVLRSNIMDMGGNPVKFAYVARNPASGIIAEADCPDDGTNPDSCQLP
jgi:hypothetical protein